MKIIIGLNLFITVLIPGLTFAEHTKAECEAAKGQIAQALEQAQTSIENKEQLLQDELKSCIKKLPAPECISKNEAAIKALRQEELQMSVPIESQLSQFEDCQRFGI